MRKPREEIAEEPSRAAVRVGAEDRMPNEVYEEWDCQQACKEGSRGDNELANDAPQVIGQSPVLYYSSFQVHGLLLHSRA